MREKIMAGHLPYQTQFVEFLCAVGARILPGNQCFGAKTLQLNDNTRLIVWQRKSPIARLPLGQAENTLKINKLLENWRVMIQIEKTIDVNSNDTKKMTKFCTCWTDICKHLQEAPGIEKAGSPAPN